MAIASASAELPPRRRMVRPLRQHVDLKFMRAADGETPWTDPACYNHAGHSSSRASTPGRLLNVRV
jgi:hypothetical protein